MLIGCGILAEEVHTVLGFHRSPVTTCFLPASLHADPARLERTLSRALERCPDRRKVVFYGSCHPGMDRLLEAAGTWRIPGQNCVEMLLGTELFERHLADGAYFLLERWTRDWDRMIEETFGPHPAAVREIFATSHRYLLGVRTPVSADFDGAARTIAEQVGLPLRWIDVGLDELTRRLDQALHRLADP